MGILTLRDGDFKGKSALVRVDYNVPLDGGKVADETRIVASLPTIDHLRKQGAKVILVSHLGRPKGKPDPAYTLRPVAEHLRRDLGVPCAFVADTVGPAALEAVRSLKAGEVLLLENIRFEPGEEKNDPTLCRKLAELCDVYVNDAFGTAHRAHASTTGVALLRPAFAGLLIEKEVVALGRALDHPEHPFTAILGGAKVSDKILVLERLVEKVDRLIVGGGMAFTFLKAEGFEVGKSLVETDKLELAHRLLERARARGVQVLLPVDVEAADSFDEKATHRACTVSAMRPEWIGLDIGPLTMESFAKAILSSKTVLWNGPMGVFEWEAFGFGTRAVAHAVAACKGTTVLGGGDSAAAAAKYGITGLVTHVSTGGGASLEYLEGQLLPGIAALEQSASQRVVKA